LLTDSAISSGGPGEGGLARDPRQRRPREGDAGRWTGLGEVHKVPIDRLLPADSPRLNGEDNERVRVLAESMDAMRPIVVDRRTMRVVDGMHRLRAAQLKRAKTIAVQYFEGSAADAFVVAVKLNAQHGLPLSRADRQAAVGRILTTHRHYSDAAIAGICGVSDKTVAAIRRSQFDTGESEVGRRLGRDGRLRPVNTGAGRQRAADVIQRNPRASLREVAAIAGLSPSTVKDVRDRLARGEHPAPDASTPRPVGETILPSDGALVRACLANLQNDPEIRSDHVGRNLLRLVRENAVEPSRWEQLADAVPHHWARQLSQVARLYAQAWSKFSQELAER
jgi:ParB-like chromosome segregation protein Spo0J